MTMTPISDAAAQLNLPEAEVRDRAQAAGLHIENTGTLETIDLEAMRAILRLSVLEPRIDALEARADTAVINVDRGGITLPILALIVSGASALAAIHVARTASDQATEAARALRATSGFAAVDQVLAGMETALGDSYRGELVEDRFMLAKLMNDEGVVSNKIWDAFMTTMCGTDKTEPSSDTSNNDHYAGTTTTPLPADDVVRVHCEAWRAK